MIPGLDCPDAPHGCGVPPDVYTPLQRRTYRTASLRQIIRNRLRGKRKTYREIAEEVGCSKSWVEQLAVGVR